MKIDVNIPDGQIGDWSVDTYEVTPEVAAFSNMRAAFGRPLERVDAGKYKRLMRGGTVVMSNTPMEIMTNQPIIRRAVGRVLINGLGLGVVLTAILQKPEVLSVTVIEKHREVIDLVAVHFTDPRLKVIHADALTYKPKHGARFDAAWHDIWDNICSDNLPEMHALHRKYGRRCGWQDSWARGYIR